MDTTETTSYTPSSSHRRALLRRLGLGLLAALALGGLGYPDPSQGSVIAATVACSAGACTTGAAA